jgi:dTDP-4-amino-4,6-dideoxygalactose transaminase
VENDDCKHSYHLYVIRIKKTIRTAFIRFLKKKKIFLGIHYDPPTHKMNNFITHKNNLLNTEKICKEIVSLPIYPELSKKNLFTVYNAINSFFLNIDKIKK